MGSWIKAQVIGNLGKDADLRFSAQGKPVLAFSVAVQVGYGDKAHTDWWDVKMFGERGEKVAQYLTKGTNVFVEGRIEKRTWQSDDGVKHNAVDLIASDVVLLGSRQGGAGGSQNSGRPQQQSRQSSPPFGQDDDDGELPF